MSRKPTISISDDYAVLTANGYRFEYYPDDYVDENGGGFKVIYKRKAIYQLSIDDIVEKLNRDSRHELWSPADYLLSAIGIWMRERNIKDED